MATTEHEEPAAPEVAPEPEEEGAAAAPAGRIAEPLTSAPSRGLFSRGRLPAGAPRAALAVALALSLTVLVRASGASAEAGLPSREPASPSPAPIAAATARPTHTMAAAPTPESTPAASPSLVGPDPAQSPLSAILKPRPGRLYEHGDSSRSDVYITIDDCRDWANVEKDLQTARKAGVHVTLFPAGKYVDADQESASRVLLEAVADGNEIGNHTYTHSRLDSGVMIDIKADLDAQLATVRKALNDETYREWFVRPPYGSGLGYQPFVTAAVKDGLAIALWSIDTKGYQAGSTVEFVLQNVFDPKHFKNGAIILMHDDAVDTAALPLIIDGIRARGFAVGGVLRNILVPGTSAGVRVGRETVQALFADVAVRAERPLRQLGDRSDRRRAT